MEKRVLNISIGKSGGNASKNAKTYRFTIPNKWAKDMGIELDNRAVEVIYDSDKKEITIKKIEE